MAKVFGREARHGTHVNYEVSKAIVAEAVKNGFSTIALEDLTLIRKHIKAVRKMPSIVGLFVSFRILLRTKPSLPIFVSSTLIPPLQKQTCAMCGTRGKRLHHRF